MDELCLRAKLGQSRGWASMEECVVVLEAERMDRQRRDHARDRSRRRLVADREADSR